MAVSPPSLCSAGCKRACVTVCSGGGLLTLCRWGGRLGCFSFLFFREVPVVSLICAGWAGSLSMLEDARLVIGPGEFSIVLR